MRKEFFQIIGLVALIFLGGGNTVFASSEGPYEECYHSCYGTCRQCLVNNNCGDDSWTAPCEACGGGGPCDIYCLTQCAKE